MISFLIVLNGCAQIMQGQQQPVKLLKDNLFVTSCGGAVETWGSCNNKAERTCNNGYVVVNKIENAIGTVRELTFQCKK